MNTVTTAPRSAAKFIDHFKRALLDSANKGSHEVYVEESHKCREYCPIYRAGKCYIPNFDEAMSFLVMDLIADERDAAEARKAGAKPNSSGSGTTGNIDRAVDLNIIAARLDALRDAYVHHDANQLDFKRMFNIVLTITRKKINDLAPEIDSILNRYGMPGHEIPEPQHDNILRNLLLMQFELRLNHTINQLADAMLKEGR